MKHMQMAADYLKPVRNWIYQSEPIKGGLKKIISKKIRDLWLIDQNLKIN